MKLLLGTILFCAAIPSAFAGPGKAGLWDSTAIVNFTKGGPNIPPAQLEIMKQRGIVLPFGTPVNSQICVTPEMAARDEPPKPTRPQDQCQVKNFNKTSTSYSVDFVCNGEMKGSASVKVSYSSNSSYTGSMDFDGVSKQGAPVGMHTDFSGKWVSEDCGTVKPHGQ